MDPSEKNINTKHKIPREVPEKDQPIPETPVLKKKTQNTIATSASSNCNNLTSPLKTTDSPQISNQLSSCTSVDEDKDKKKKKQQPPATSPQQLPTPIEPLPGSQLKIHYNIPIGHRGEKLKKPYNNKFFIFHDPTNDLFYIQVLQLVSKYEQVLKMFPESIPEPERNKMIKQFTSYLSQNITKDPRSLKVKKEVYYTETNPNGRRITLLELQEVDAVLSKYEKNHKRRSIETNEVWERICVFASSVRSGIGKGNKITLDYIKSVEKKCTQEEIKAQEVELRLMYNGGKPSNRHRKGQTYKTGSKSEGYSPSKRTADNYDLDKRRKNNKLLRPEDVNELTNMVCDCDEIDRSSKVSLEAIYLRLEKTGQLVDTTNINDNEVLRILISLYKLACSKDEENLPSVKERIKILIEEAKDNFTEYNENGSEFGTELEGGKNEKYNLGQISSSGTGSSSEGSSDNSLENSKHD
jgi:hypothetical protein